MAKYSRSSLPYGAFGAIIAFLTGVLVLVLRSRRWPTYGVRLPASADVITHTPESAIVLPETLPTGLLPAASDDLTLIEGIGTKIAAVLNAAGIHRLEQLANASPEELVRILRAAGNRLSSPTSWPQQAKLAAAAKWDELKALQSTLKAGRAG